MFVVLFPLFQKPKPKGQLLGVLGEENEQIAGKGQR
jgi:hypothetical protein